MKSVQLKVIGQNVILIVDNEQFSIKMVEKKDRENIKVLVDSYLKKPSDKVLDNILKMFPKKDDKKAKKSPPPKPTKDEPVEVQKVVEKVQQEAPKSEPVYEQVAPRKRFGGEY